MIQRLLPQPVVSALLAAAWLVLAGSVAPLQLLGAVVIAIGVPLAVDRLLGEPVAVVRPLIAARLGLVVLWDIVVANLVVARLVLGPPARLRPGFVIVPLDTRHADANALLASIISMTPGTVSADVDDSRTRILVHVLDLDEPERLVENIKQRYERPIKEVFGC